LKHFDIEGYFSFVSAGDMEQKHCEKEDIIRNALKQTGTKDLSEAVMVGDRKYDINGAKLCGIDSIGVLYGYGNLKELKEAGAIAEVVYSLEEVKELMK
jgi:phosphoglycolate phosphatase